MESKYFKRRKPFDFTPHRFDVGVPFSKNNTHADVHFFIKVQKLPESELEDLFLRHFNYYKDNFKNDSTGREFFKDLWRTVNSELKKERSKSQEKLSAKQKRRNDLRIQKFQYFIENVLPKYDQWNFTVSMSKKYDMVSEQLMQEVKSKTQIEFQRTQELIDSAFTKLVNSSNVSTETNIKTIKTILDNYLDSNKEEQEELRKHFIQKQNLDRLLAQYNTALEELDEFKEQVKKLKKEKSRLSTLDHHKIDIVNGTKQNLIALFQNLMDTDIVINGKPKTFLANSAPIIWAKIISNHFLENGKPIPFGTVENYYSDGKPTNIEDSDCRFNIIPIE